MSTVTTERAPMPSLAPPDGEGFSHITLDGRVALCGYPKSRHGGHGLVTDRRHCQCGAPVCPTCRDLAELFERTGIAEWA